jgi:hypothetical protein
MDKAVSREKSAVERESLPALPAALGALTGRLERMADAVVELARAVDDDRESLHTALDALANGLEARAVDREARLAEAASSRLIARAEDFIGRPTEAVAAAVCKSVEDVATELRSLSLDLKKQMTDLSQTTASLAMETIDTRKIIEQKQMDKADKTETLNEILNAGLGHHTAEIAAASARLDTLFERLDRLDARVERAHAEAPTLEDFGEIAEMRVSRLLRDNDSNIVESLTPLVINALTHNVHAQTEEMTSKVMSCVSAQLTATLKSEGDAMNKRLTHDLAMQMRAEVTGQISHKLPEYVRRETKSELATFEDRFSKQAGELAHLAKAFNDMKPVEASVVKLDTLLARLSALPAEISAVSEAPGKT